MKRLKKGKLRAAFIWLFAASFIASGFAPVFAQGAWDQLQKAHTQGFGSIESGRGQGIPLPLPARITSPAPREVHPGRTEFPTIAELELVGFTQEELGMIYAIGLFIEQKYVDSVERKKIFYGALKGMTNELDPNSAFHTPEEYKMILERMKGSYAGVGMVVKPKKKGEPVGVKFTFPGSPAEKAGIKPGDQILRIDGEDAIPLELNDAIDKIKGKPGTYVELTIQRDSGEEGKPASIFKVRVERNRIKLSNLRGQLLPNQDRIGYIQLESFRDDSDELFAEEVKKLASQGRGLLEKPLLNGLIVDLRNNTGGQLDTVVNMCEMFLEKEKVIVFGYHRNKKVMEEKTKKNGPYTGLPLVVLVNGLSASASEIFAGSMQDHKRATIIGSKTLGKGTVQSIFPFRDGSALRLTMQRYHLPSGRCIDGTMTGKEAGLDPDMGVDLSEDDEAKLAGQLYRKLMGVSPEGETIRDEALEKALELLGGQKAISFLPAENLQPAWASAY